MIAPISFEVFNIEEYKKLKKKNIDKKYYDNNKEKVQKRNSNWKKNNPEKTRATNKRFYELNPNYLKNWRINNKERIKETNKKWRQNNPSKVDVKWRWYDCKKEFLEDKKLICNSCLKKLKPKEAEVDHILCKYLHPELEFVETNLQILCHKCHQHKTWCDRDLIKRIRKGEGLVSTALQNHLWTKVGLGCNFRLLHQGL